MLVDGFGVGGGAEGVLCLLNDGQGAGLDGDGPGVDLFEVAGETVHEAVDVVDGRAECGCHGDVPPVYIPGHIALTEL